MRLIESQSLSIIEESPPCLRRTVHGAESHRYGEEFKPKSFNIVDPRCCFSLFLLSAER